jgi:hypothetical protein
MELSDDPPEKETPDMIEVTPYAGDHITTFAKALVRVAAEHGAAKGTFNDVEVTADRGATEDSICADWQRKWDAKCTAYRNSPEGTARAAQRDAEIATRQEQHDTLMRDLATLDFRHDVAVLDWLCAFQDCADDVSVVKDKAAVLSAFTAAGFAPNVNCSAEYNGEDRDNACRYLVGQALAGIERVGAPHGIVLKFADDWKAKFLGTP